MTENVPLLYKLPDGTVVQPVLYDGSGSESCNRCELQEGGHCGTMRDCVRWNRLLGRGSFKRVHWRIIHEDL